MVARGTRHFESKTSKEPDMTKMKASGSTLSVIARQVWL